jgi:type IV secretion system protein VirB4
MIGKAWAAGDAFSVITPVGNAFLTKTGGLVIGIDLSGFAPDAASFNECVNNARLARVIYSALLPGVNVSQYYIQAEGHRVHLRRREHGMLNRLVEARETALNDRGLSISRLVHLLTIPDVSGWNANLLATLVKNLPMAPFDPRARKILKARFSSADAINVQIDDLEQRYSTLLRMAEDAAAKWSILMQARVMDRNELWAIMKYLGSFDPKYLDEGVRYPVPDDDCDLALSSGDIDPVQIEYQDSLAITGPTKRFARLAAVTKIPRSPVGVYVRDAGAPLMVPGTFTIALNFQMLSEFDRSWKFKVARTRLERTKLNLFNMIQGDDKKAEKRRVYADKLEELEKAEATDDRWCFGQLQVAVASDDPARMLATCAALDTSFQARGVHLSWEGAALPTAFMAFQPGGYEHGFRRTTLTLSRAATLSLTFRNSTGIPSVPDLAGEEPQYVFETESGQPFWYTPFIGGKSFVIGIGPTRSGKTFAKNTLGAHFLKYGGFLRAIDIDPGTEALAQAFGDDGGVFRMGPAAYPANPFVSSTGPEDIAFRAHMISLIKLLLQVNDAEEARTLTIHDQQDVDRALLETQKLPTEMQNLRTFVEHLPLTLQKRFSRWLPGGAFAGIFDAERDGIGSVDKPIGVFNLQAYRDNIRVLQPLMLEIFYRLTILVESPHTRSRPKLLDIDEAHHALRVPEFRDYIVAKVRTWGKFFGGINLWSQSPKEFLETPGWDAVRSAATTFIFMADPSMDVELYKQTFLIDDTVCEAISKLTPRREMLIVQPEMGIVQKVVLRPEPEQYVINTSKPDESALRDQLVSEFGFDEGLRRTVKEIQRRANAGVDAVAAE